MNKEEFVKELRKINIEITEEILKKFEIYKDFLIEYNSHTNLTAIKEEKDIYLKHFYDSLTANEFVKENDKVLDMGTGAGFPGMVLALKNPNSSFVLLDSNNKKINFLTLLKDKLNMNNVEIVHARAEEYIRNHLEEFDVVTSRAVAELRILAELSLPALKVGGIFIPLKSNIEKEISIFNDALVLLNGKLIEKKEFLLPIENSKRTILKIEHFAKTDELYPRSYDKILKKPLKIKKK